LVSYNLPSYNLPNIHYPGAAVKSKNGIYRINAEERGMTLPALQGGERHFLLQDRTINVELQITGDDDYIHLISIREYNYYDRDVD
jgi:hypothetical protein